MNSFRSPTRHGRAALAAALLATLLAPPAGNASELIDRNASAVKLEVDGSGRALVTYRAAGKLRRVLVWGAVNAIAPTTARRQISFTLDYSGGKSVLSRLSCGEYDGPLLAWKVAACKAPDGSYWAVQAWQRALPDYGLPPTPAKSAWELRLSHWTGPLAVLEVELDWAYRRYDHLFGRYTYRGKPVFGFRSTSAGVPLDTFGRNLYLDTSGSAYGPGWRRENSFLTHRGTGTFCYGFFPHDRRPAGRGSRYRLTVQGPGVTPDVMWQGDAPGPYDAAADADANARIAAMKDRLCRPN